MTPGPAFLELAAERRPQPDDFLRRWGEGGPSRRSGATGDVAVDVWQRLRGTYLLLADEFARQAGGASLQVSVPFDDEPVAIDGTLAGRLIDIYAACGWSGVTTVTAAVREHVPAAHEDLSGGTVLDPWVFAWRFVRGTRNLLAIVVAECLRDLEDRVARAVTANLDDVLAKLKQVRERLGLQVSLLDTTMPPMAGASPLPQATVLYTATEAETERAYHAAMLELVAHRDRVEGLAASLVAAEKALKGQKAQDIVNRPYWSELPARDSERTKAAAARVEDVRTLVAEASATLEAVQQQIARNEPALLLLLPVMRQHWTPALMTQMLGGILREVEDSVKEHRPGPAPRWASTLAGVAPGQDPIAPDVVARLEVPEDGFERHAVRYAAASGGSTADLVPLIVEPLWADLLDRSLPRSSFAYAVGTWYLIELGDHLMEREAAAATRATWLKHVRFVSAMVSLALIWLPPASAAVRGVVLAVDLLLAAEALYGLAAGYSAAGSAMGLAGAETGAGVESLTQAARYCSFRRDLLATMPAQVLLEIAAVPLGAASRDLRRLLLLRGWYNDLQTVAAWSPRPEER